MTRRPGRDRRVDGGQRQAVALVEPAGHVGHDRDTEPAQGDGQDRQAGQAVGIEVAEDLDQLAALARVRRRRASRSPASGRRRVMQPSQRIAKPGAEIFGRLDASPRQETRQARRDLTSRGGR